MWYSVEKPVKYYLKIHFSVTERCKSFSTAHKKKKAKSDTGKGEKKLGRKEFSNNLKVFAAQ